MAFADAQVNTRAGRGSPDPACLRTGSLPFRRDELPLSPMPKSTLAFLQLIRLPNVVTAAADSLAGWLLVTGSLSAPWRWLPLVVSSMVLYASGTILNDVLDFEIDRIERPGRPLPSGRVSRRVAAWLGGLGLLLGPCLALASGSIMSGLLAAVLALAILSYDSGLKHTLLGPEVMGACRGLNLLLGMTHAAAFGGPVAWLAALAYGIYVAGITIASRSEAIGGARVAGRRTGLSDDGHRRAGSRQFFGTTISCSSRGQAHRSARGASRPGPGRSCRERRGLACDRAPGSRAHPTVHQNGNLEPGVAARRSDRRGPGPGARTSDHRALASCLHPGQVALFDLMTCNQAWSGRGEHNAG